MSQRLQLDPGVASSAEVDELEAAFSSCCDRARAVAARITGDPAEAADLVQEAYMRAERRLGGFRRDTSLERWFLRIVVNLALKHERWRSVRRRLRGLIPLPSGQPTPEEELVAADRRVQLEVALRGLPAKQRAAFVLRHVEDLSIAEVAKVLEVSESTVKTHLVRATEKLRRTMRRGEGR